MDMRELVKLKYHKFSASYTTVEEILLDVWIPRKGFILPKQFIKLFSNESWMPQVVYEGKYNLDEGMMCKGFDKRQQQWMAKIKTKTYLDKLKTKYGDGWEKMI